MAGALVAQHQHIARRQHVPFGDVLDFPRSSVRAYQRERSFLLAFFEKGLPAFRNHRLEAGLRKIVQTAADDLFPWEAQELAGADTGFAVMAIVVCDQNRHGRLEDDRPEQKLEFLRTVLHQPTR